VSLAALGFLGVRSFLPIPIKYSLLERRAAPVREEGAMAFSEELAERIRQALARKRGVEEKKMFGGVGFLLDGNMLVGVWKDSLIVRLGPEEGDAALKEPHVSEFDITGRSMKGWVLVAPEGIENDDQLGGWVQRAVKFVGKMPAK
jgi:TfoX/Sxy family transcriptional regulator of competence genes